MHTSMQAESMCMHDDCMYEYAGLLDAASINGDLMKWPITHFNRSCRHSASEEGGTESHHSLHSLYRTFCIVLHTCCIYPLEISDSVGDSAMSRSLYGISVSYVNEKLDLSKPN